MDLKGKRLYRSKYDRKISGVCGGIAEYFGIDPTIVRLVWALFALFAGAGIWAYIISALIIPEEPYDYNSGDTSDKKPFDK